MKKIFILLFALVASIATMFAIDNGLYLLDSIVRVNESTGFVDTKAIYEYHSNGTKSRSISLRASWSSWKVGIPMILNSKITWEYDEEGNEIDYYWSQLDTATGIWQDSHHYLYDEKHNRVCGVRKWNKDSTVVLQGSHYYYDEENFQIGSDQFDTWNGIQVLDYKCTNAKDTYGNKIIMVEYSKPDSAWTGDYMSDPDAFNKAGWIPIDSVYYTYNEKQEKTKETIYRWDKDNKEWKIDGYQIFEYDAEEHFIADTVFARDFETGIITYNNMTSRVFDDHGNAIRTQSYLPKFTEQGVEWIDNGTSFVDYTYNEDGIITQQRTYSTWPEQSSAPISYLSTYYYSNHAKSEDPVPCFIASGTCGDNLTWDLSCDSVLTIKGNGAMHDFNWDSPWSAYKDSIKTVIVEEGVTSIGATAFRDHIHLQHCSLPSTLLSIGNEAFCFCFQLISIEIPASCTSFNGYGTFNLVPNVVIQDESLLHECAARSINGYVEGYFVYADETKKSLRACSSAAKGEITLDDAIERIEYMAFAQCEDITNILWGSNLKYIGEWSLNGCRGLEGLRFQEGLEEIASNAFGNCFGLKYVYLPNSLITVGDFAIGNCPDLHTIHLGKSLSNVGNQFLDYCQNLDTIYAPMLTPPQLDNSVLQSSDIPHLICYVPNGSLLLYKGATIWKEMNLQTMDSDELNPDHPINPGNYQLSLIETEESMGTVSGAGLYPQGTVVQIEATPHNCYQFARWSDGVTENPRLLTLTRDTTLSAEWTLVTIASGTCGAQTDNLRWFISCDGVLTISGTGEMADYSEDERAPWFEYADTIVNIIVEEGVSSIGECAFLRCEKAGTVSLPSSLRKINRAAFAYTNFISLSLPEGVEELGYYVFQDCHMLSNIKIPGSVKHIGYSAFYNCIQMMQFTVDETNAHYRDIDGVLFSKDTTVLISYACGREGAYTIPNGVKTINTNAFRHSMHLSKVTLPEGLDTIGHGAFFACWEMVSVNFPSTVVSIGDQAFAHCKALTELTIPQHVVQIYDNAFWDCIGLTKITSQALIPPTPAGHNPERIFENVDKNIPLYVPYSAVDAYRNSEPWSEFTDIRPIEIIVSDEQNATDLPIDKFTHIVVNSTGHLYIDEPTNAYALTLKYSDEGQAQVSWIDNLIAETVDIALTLPGNDISGKWNAFAVPFEVSVETGIQREGANAPASYGVDFVIDEYNGVLRADTQDGWQRIAANATLYPGKLYMMATNGENKWRLTASNPSAIQEINSVNVESYPSNIGSHHAGWNGVANTLWHEAKASLNDVEYLTIYNNTLGVYEVLPLSETILRPSQPFFVQVPEAGSILFNTHHASYSPAYIRAEKTDEMGCTLMFASAETTQTNYIDKGYLKISSNKENTYQIGHDLIKMQTKNACVPQIWLENYNSRLAACELSAGEQMLSIGLYAPADGRYTLRLNDVLDTFTLNLLKNGEFIGSLSDVEVLLDLEKGDNTGYCIQIAQMPTAIEEAEEDTDSRTIRKELRNGQIIIHRGDKTYTITGQEVK